MLRCVLVGEPIVLILCSTPPHSSSFQPTPAKVDVFVLLWSSPDFVDTFCA